MKQVRKTMILSAGPFGWNVLNIIVALYISMASSMTSLVFGSDTFAQGALASFVFNGNMGMPQQISAAVSLQYFE